MTRLGQHMLNINYYMTISNNVKSLLSIQQHIFGTPFQKLVNVFSLIIFMGLINNHAPLLYPNDKHPECTFR